MQAILHSGGTHHLLEERPLVAPLGEWAPDAGSSLRRLAYLGFENMPARRIVEHGGGGDMEVKWKHCTSCRQLLQCWAE